ncbi:MAG TPA: GNAT family N-acetyltransferase [Solirubrobacteraceae bacterium]|nr:GNAT family N-acetyltransferase [Solirubrobacteraceae bacterium]
MPDGTSLRTEWPVGRGPLLHRIEEYYDAVPRSAARVEEHGPLRLFVAEGVPWPYYARPAGGEVTADDVRAVRRRQWELGAPEAFEWVAELAPTLAPAARETGLQVMEVPLMVHDRPRDAPPVAAGVRRLEPDDPALAASRAVADLAFRRSGDAGPAERDAALAGWPEGRLAAVRRRMAAGITVTLVAEDEDGVLAVGSHQPVGDVTEVVGVGTLPAARRRGLGAAITAALVADARRGGAEVVVLSAGSERIARLYGRLGFRRLGTAGLAVSS